MKPKVFIGSSVEGLSIAYSLQQNLNHDAEITVWDQGVFTLSSTTIESLIEKLESSDFAIFVFSPDDVRTIRDTSKKTVRDNVLFEFGLFIGKLGRNRVFFITPNDFDIDLPSDLIGITPGKYDPNREDGSMQAATGPVSHQIRTQINEIGSLRVLESEANDEALSTDVKENSEDWLSLIFDKKYDEAKSLLKQEIEAASEDENTKSLNLWILYCDYKIDPADGSEKLSEYLQANKDKISYLLISQFYNWENNLPKAISVAEEGLKIFPHHTTLTILLSNYKEELLGMDSALQVLSSDKLADNHEVLLQKIELLEKYKKKDQAFQLIHDFYKKYPNIESVIYKFSSLAYDQKKYNISFYLLNGLIQEYPNKAEYWGYFSNSALMHNLYETSFSSLVRANEIYDKPRSWIFENMGNLMNNKGFFSESIKYLRQALEIEKESDYAADRLHSALKNRSEEEKQVAEICSKGKKEIWAEAVSESET